MASLDKMSRKSSEICIDVGNKGPRVFTPPHFEVLHVSGSVSSSSENFGVGAFFECTAGAESAGTRSPTPRTPHAQQQAGTHSQSPPSHQILVCTKGISRMAVPKAEYEPRLLAILDYVATRPLLVLCDIIDCLPLLPLYTSAHPVGVLAQFLLTPVLILLLPLYVLFLGLYVWLWAPPQYLTSVLFPSIENSFPSQLATHVPGACLQADAYIPTCERGSATWSASLSPNSASGAAPGEPQHTPLTDPSSRKSGGADPTRRPYRRPSLRYSLPRQKQPDVGSAGLNASPLLLAMLHDDLRVSKTAARHYAHYMNCELFMMAAMKSMTGCERAAPFVAKPC